MTAAYVNPQISREFTLGLAAFRMVYSYFYNTDHGFSFLGGIRITDYILTNKPVLPRIPIHVPGLLDG